MGVTKLMDFIRKKAPKSIMPINIQAYHSKTLSVDASNVIYQFLIKTQSMALTNSINNQSNKTVKYPTDWQGNKTGHLMGIMYRVLMLLENNISTIWVFDGPPPQEKYEQLKRRRKLKQQAEQKLDQILNQQDIQLNALQYSQRTIRITQSQKKEAIKLLQLIGLPVIQSLSQAQPQCAYLVKQKCSYGVVSEDMDTLVYGSQKIIRGLSRKNTQVIIGAQSLPFQVDLNVLLSQLQLTYDQFVDFCILCGCDYSPKIDKIGPINAYKLIKQYQNIDKILQSIASIPKLRQKFHVPDQFNHLRARYLFKNPKIKSLLQIYNQKEQIKIQSLTQKNQKQLKQKHFTQKQTKIDQIRQFLIKKQFSINRVQNWLQRVKKARNIH